MLQKPGLVKILSYIGILCVVLVIGIPVLLTIVISVSSYFGSRPEKKVSEGIPQYVNAQRWESKSSCGSLGSGPCGTDIYFYTTDSKDIVFTYYKENLNKLGWEYTSEGNTTQVKTGNPEQSYIGFKKANEYTQLEARPNNQTWWNYYFRFDSKQ